MSSDPANILTDNTNKALRGEVNASEPIPEDDNRSKQKRTQTVGKREVLAQDAAQAQESQYRQDVVDYRREFQEWLKAEEKYKQDLKAYEAEEAKAKKAYEAAKLSDERLDARWYVIPKYSETRYYDAQKGAEKYLQVGLKRATNQEEKQKVFSEYQKRVTAAKQGYNKEYKSRIEHNKRLDEKFGGRPRVGSAKVGVLSRTSADILGGKSDVPLKQTSSHIQNQVRNIRLVERYNRGNMTLREFYNARDGVSAKVAQKAAAEQARRNWSSAISARSNLAKSREAHQHKLRDMNKQNRLSQMAQQTAMLDSMRSKLTAGGIDFTKLKPATGRPQQQTRVDPVKVSPQRSADEPVQERSAGSIFDISQSDFARLQAGRGLNEKMNVSEWQSTRNPTKFQQVNKGQVQGAPRPGKQVWTVTDPNTGKERTFTSEESAQKFADRLNKSETSYYFPGDLMSIFSAPKPDKTDPLSNLTASQQPAVKGFSTSGNPLTEKILGGIDAMAKKISSVQKETAKTNPNSPQDVIASTVDSIWSQGTSMINLGSLAGDLIQKQSEPKSKDGKIEEAGQPMKERRELHVSKTFDTVFMEKGLEGVINPGGDKLIDIEKASFERGQKAAQEQWGSQSMGTNVGQVVGLAAPILITGGVGVVKKGLGIKSTNIELQSTTKTLTGAPVKLSTPVAKEYGAFGKTLFTKTFNEPGLIQARTITKPVKKFGIKQKDEMGVVKTVTATEHKLASTKGKYSLGSTDPKRVLSKVDVNPSGTGFELGTGSKNQFQFNKKLVDELVHQKKLDQLEAEKFRLVQEGTKIALKTPREPPRSMGAKPLQKLDPGVETMTFMGAIRNIQSPKNFLKGRTRVDQVGGSASQQVQLREKWTKQEIHDFDIDVKSEAVAKRSARTVYEKMEPLSTDTKAFRLSPGRETKVEVIEGAWQYGLGKQERAPNILYHGTDLSSVGGLFKKIKTSKAGERTGKTMTESATKRYVPENTFFATHNPNLASQYGGDAAAKLGRGDAEFGAVKFRIKDVSKNKYIDRIDPEKYKLAHDIDVAKKQGYSSITRPQGKNFSNPETITWDVKNLQPIKKIKASPQPITQAEFDAVGVKGVKPGVTDEFVEFLSPEDKIKGMDYAQESGLRFGEKYRVDKLSKIFKRPIKDPVHGVKVRDIKDQLLAKSASAVSFQGKESKVFKGTPEPGSFEARMSKDIEAGKLTINPPVHRGKDVVDLYRIYKSSSETYFTKGKVTEGQKLQSIAEQLKSKYPDIDFDKNLKGDFKLQSETSSISMLSRSAASSLSQTKPAAPLTSRISVKKESTSSTSKRSERAYSSFSKKTDSIKTSAASKTTLGSSIGAATSTSLFSAKSARAPTSRPVIRSARSFRSPRSSRSVSKSITTKSPRVLSPRSATTRSPKPIKPKSPTTRSPSVPGKPLKGAPTSRGFGIAIGKGTTVFQEKIKPRTGITINIKNTEDKKPGLQHKTHDFLGSSKTDHIVGLFRRKTVIHGDKRTNKQVLKDKKVDPYGDHVSGIGFSSKRKGGLKL